MLLQYALFSDNLKEENCKVITETSEHFTLRNIMLFTISFYRLVPVSVALPSSVVSEQ